MQYLDHHYQMMIVMELLRHNYVPQCYSIL